eukprot:scaffold4186_cov110-Isochrysis_galbana.AAC.4
MGDGARAHLGLLVVADERCERPDRHPHQEEELTEDRLRGQARDDDCAIAEPGCLFDADRAREDEVQRVGLAALLDDDLVRLRARKGGGWQEFAGVGVREERCVAELRGCGVGAGGRGGQKLRRGRGRCERCVTECMGCGGREYGCVGRWAPCTFAAGLKTWPALVPRPGRAFKSTRLRMVAQKDEPVLRVECELLRKRVAADGLLRGVHAVVAGRGGHGHRLIGRHRLHQLKPLDARPARHPLRDGQDLVDDLAGLINVGDGGEDERLVE